MIENGHIGGITMDEDLRHLREDLLEVGCSEGEITEAERLLQAGSFDDLIKHLRRCRCALMDEMHKCGRKVDRIDYLIRRSLQISK